MPARRRAAPGRCAAAAGEADHPLVVGDGHEQRSVGVAVAEERVDLERRTAGIGGSMQWQWYTIRSNTDSARIRMGPSWP